MSPIHRIIVPKVTELIRNLFKSSDAEAFQQDPKVEPTDGEIIGTTSTNNYESFDSSFDKVVDVSTLRGNHVTRLFD